jgi:hypothetical protein
MTTDDKRLRVLDNETGAELAELGLSVKLKAVACFECRFNGGYSHMIDGDSCKAFNVACSKKNPNADCAYFEPRPSLVPALAGPPSLAQRAIGFATTAFVVSVVSLIINIVKACA